MATHCLIATAALVKDLITVLRTHMMGHEFQGSDPLVDSVVTRHANGAPLSMQENICACKINNSLK